MGADRASPGTVWFMDEALPLPGLAADEAAGWASNDGVRIHWRIDVPHGRSGSPLLLINGLGSPLVAFEPGFVARLVERGLAVVRFDNRDVGRSDRVTVGPPGARTPYTIHDMAADAVAVLDAVGWERANVLGQSMGGMIAQQLAIDHPERVSGLIPLMSSSGEPGFGRPTAEARDALLQTAPQERRAWLEHRVESERVWASPGLASDEWLLAKGRAMWDHGVDSRGSLRQFRAIRAAGSRDESLAHLTVPTLVLHGSADVLIAPDGGRHLAEVIPGARYHEIEGLGHDLPPDLWDAVADEVAAFVVSVPEAG